MRIGRRLTYRPASSGARAATAAAVVPTAALLLAGCGAVPGTSGAAPSTQPAAPAATAGATRSPSASAAPVAPARLGGPQDVATGLAAPWGLAFLPDGSALVTERDSALVKRVTQDGAVQEVGRVAGVNAGGEGGLLGIAVSPSFRADSRVFLYLTAAEDNRIVRTTYDTATNRLGSVEPIVTGIPISGVHNGGRLAFGPDGMLYAGTGDASETGLSQDVGSLGGKVLRMTQGGRPAADNPVPGSLVFSLGHRNVQGLDWDEDGRLWASEFGQDRVDEVNLVEPGGNYGWPRVEGGGAGPEYVDPLVEWEPAEASPSGATVAAGSFWVAGLRGQRLWQVPLDGEEVGTPVSHLDGQLGRLRLVTEAPDGSLWVVTNNTDGRGEPRDGDDRIVRLPVYP